MEIISPKTFREIVGKNIQKRKDNYLPIFLGNKEKISYEINRQLKLSETLEPRIELQDVIIGGYSKKFVVEDFIELFETYFPLWKIEYVSDAYTHKIFKLRPLVQP